MIMMITIVIITKNNNKKVCSARHRQHICSRNLNIYSAKYQIWRSYVIVRPVIRSVVLFVTRITHERGNGRRPNMVGMGKR